MGCVSVKLASIHDTLDVIMMFLVLFSLQLLHTLQSYLLNICHQPDFAKTSQKEGVKSQIQSLLESFRGAALATNTRNIQTLFDYLLPVLRNCVVLLSVYQNCPEMVVLVLEFYVDVVDAQISFLGEVGYICFLCFV